LRQIRDEPALRVGDGREERHDGGARSKRWLLEFDRLRRHAAERGESAGEREGSKGRTHVDSLSHPRDGRLDWSDITK
jgi:hypothetical protein